MNVGTHPDEPEMGTFQANSREKERFQLTPAPLTKVLEGPGTVITRDLQVPSPDDPNCAANLTMTLPLSVHAHPAVSRCIQDRADQIAERVGTGVMTVPSCASWQSIAGSHSKCSMTGELVAV